MMKLLVLSMNKAIVFQLKTTLKNSFKLFLKKPLKMIGTSIGVLYLMIMPFMFYAQIRDFNLNNPRGFVLLNAIITLYILMPMTLSYFKRSGINFSKSDVHFMFSSPLTPKQIIVYGLMKQMYIVIIMQVSIFLAAIFIFELPFILALVYTIFTLVVSSLLDYSLAMIMYTAEFMSDQIKRLIKYAVWAVLLLITGYIGVQVYLNGFKLETFYTIINDPIIVLTPIFGWKIGMANLFFMNVNTLNIVASILYIIFAEVFVLIAAKMTVMGDYYEDALMFSDKQEKLMAKKGELTLLEAFGKKKKVHKVKGQLKGQYAKVIFSKQILELRRSSRFIVRFSDLVSLAASIVVGFSLLNVEVYNQHQQLYFTIISGVTLYFAFFFSSNMKWKDDFNHYFMYLIPASNWYKLFYATLVESLRIGFNSLCLSIPAAIILKVNPLLVILTTLVIVSMRLVIMFKSILFDGYIKNKLGAFFAQIGGMFLTIILMIIPMVLIGLSFVIGTLNSAIFIFIYCGAALYVLMYFCTNAFNNIENLKANS